MKLITKDIARKLHRADQKFLASKNGTTSDKIIVKFFTPWGAASWYIVSGTPLNSINGEPCEPEDAKDWHLFGYANLGDPTCAELGYVLLSQLQEIRGQFGLTVERDMYFGNHTLAEVQS